MKEKKITVKCIRAVPKIKRVYKCSKCGEISEDDVELDDVLVYKCKKCGGEVEKDIIEEGTKTEIVKETVCEVLKEWTVHKNVMVSSSNYYSEGGLVRDSYDYEIVLRKVLVLVRLPFRRWTCVLVLDKDEKRVLWVEDKHGTVDRRFFGKESALDELVVEYL